MLNLAEEKAKHVIFVSGDEKADWWHQSGKKPLYPRFELVDEFRERTDGKSFHIISLSKLLELFETDEEVVNSVKKSEEESDTTKSSTKIVQRLLNHKLRKDKIYESNNTCDICGFACTSERSILEIHHIIPLSEGGQDTMENLLLLCPNCHRLEHRK